MPGGELIDGFTIGDEGVFLYRPVGMTMRDARNWSYNAKDTRLLQVGESGRQAWVVG